MHREDVEGVQGAQARHRRISRGSGICELRVHGDPVRGQGAPDLQLLHSATLSAPSVSGPLEDARGAGLP